MTPKSERYKRCHNCENTFDAPHGSVVSRLPKLRTMRDSDPITGEVWVVDENNHQVACFRIKRPECHLKGATNDIMDANRNMVVAESLIEHLYTMWDIERCQTK